MSSPGQGNPLGVTYEGYIGSTYDALVLFEACLMGTLNHVPRRPHDRERENLIRSGAVFIYEEHSSGIKRWTDGYNWSPSRILGNFLIYRELEGPFPPGEKKRARKPNNKKQGVKSDTSRASAMMSAVMANGNAQLTDEQQRQQEELRMLVGSLIDSYQFKGDGLVKKTISINWQGVSHHLVSYYNVDDVLSKRLVTPSNDPKLNHVTPRPALFTGQNFRSPVTDDAALAQLQQNGGMDPHSMPHGYHHHHHPQHPGAYMPPTMARHPQQHPQHVLAAQGWTQYAGHSQPSFDMHVPHMAISHGQHFAGAPDFAYNQHHRASISGPVNGVANIDAARRHSSQINMAMQYDHALPASHLSSVAHNHHDSSDASDMTTPSHTAGSQHHGLGHASGFPTAGEFATYSTAPQSFVGDSLLVSTSVATPSVPATDYKAADFGHGADGIFSSEPYKSENYSQQLHYGSQPFPMS